MAERVYLDYAATAPLDSRVLEAMLPYMQQPVANPNTLYREGREAFAALEAARHSIAANIGAYSPEEVVFTSGGSESDAAAIIGIVQGMEASQPGKVRKRIVVSAFEHHAVLEDAHLLARAGYEVEVVKPDAEGYVTPGRLAAALEHGACLASVMTANNEAGTIMATPELARVAHEAGALFHTDAVQALGKVDLSLEESGVDAASFAAHKIGGPLGIGGLYLRRGTPFQAQVPGGGQESGRRSGTQNVAGAAGFAKALEIACESRSREAARLVQMRDHLANALLAISPRVHLVADPRGKGYALDGTGHLPGMLCICVDGIESETMVLRFDEAGFMVSGGSACSTGSLEASHVLLAMGIGRDRAFGELRFTMGPSTTEEQVERLIAAFPAVIK